MLCRVGANLVFALFLCGVGNVRTRISQIGANGRNSIVFVILPPPCHSERPPFVIPNIVRNLAREKNEILRFALNDRGR